MRMNTLKLILAGIMIAGASVVYVGQNGDTPLKLAPGETIQETLYEGVEQSVIGNKKEKIAFSKMAEVEVTSPEENNSVIPTNASFDLKFSEDVSQEYVENVFEIKPQINFTVSKVSPKYYRLTTVNGLREDEIYNILEKTTDGTKKWAFQTERVFKVEYTYPSDGQYITETGTPEIRFNGEISKDTPISKYVRIEPNIGGKWEQSYTYNYRFEPSGHFDPSKTYKITVLKGLKDVYGNELKEDYSFSFSIENVEDIAANLTILNNYKPNSKIDLNLNLSMNMNKALSIKEAKLKIIDLGSKEEFVKALKDVKYIENVTKYYEMPAVYEKDLKDQITAIYNEEKSKNRYYYYDEIPLDTNLVIPNEGYYLSLLNINSNVSTALFQVNESTATTSVLANCNFMILYKGKDGANNSVDVYVNDEKLGTTNEEGFLYVESFNKIIKNLKEDVNFVEFKNGKTNYICDITGSVNRAYEGENYLTSNAKFNNGYIYVDRNSYKPGETVHIWGYAKNRKVEIKEATLRVTSNWDDVLVETPVKLDEVGTFSYEYQISDVNKESYVSVDLLVGDTSLYSRSFNVKEYELKQYQIEVTPEATKYLDGDTAKINVSAQTYDGTPLKNTEFYYSINNKYYYNNNAKEQNGTVVTDEFGKATIQVPLVFKTKKTNIMPENIRVTILNSLIDGEQEVVNFTVYPYKHYADGTAKYIVDEGKYYLSFDEYLSLDNKVPANDSIKVVAKAYKTVRTVTGQKYNKYLKEMVDVVDYKEVAQTQYDKTFTISMKDGKGTYNLPNYSKDKNCYYRFYAYLITDTGKELGLNYSAQIYSYSYKTVFDEVEYEEVEYVDPIINPELTYRLVNEKNNRLKVGDEVKFYLQDDDGKRLNDYSKFEFYTLVVSAEGNVIVKHKGEAPHFVFNDKMGANCAVYTLMYDTLKTYSPSANASIYYSYYTTSNLWYPSSNTINLCEDEISLNLDITFSKEVYEPRDEATIKIKVTDKNGKGVKAGVNLSAVDTAFIDANGNVDANIINSLYNRYYIASSNSGLKTYSRDATDSVNSMAKSLSASGAMVEEASMAMADEAGGADSEATLRDDLRATAFFESIVTDDNGIATITIPFPDNITEWTINAQAISKDFKAKSDEKKIKVSKDFFVNLNHNDKYLVGEKFAFNVKSFSKEYTGKTANIQVSILDANDKVIEQRQLTSKAGEVLSYKVSKPITTAGTYKIKVTASCEGVKDAILDEIEIVNSLLDTNIREDLIVKVGDRIAIVSPKGYLYILNEDVAKILPMLFSLDFLYGENRNDSTLLRKEASRILSDLYNGKEFEYKPSYNYELENDENLFKVMKNGSQDVRFALKMMATHAISINDNKIFDKVEVRLGEYAKLWAKASCDKISLRELRAAKNEFILDTSRHTKEDALYLALAFAEIGSYDEAYEIYNKIKDDIKETEQNEFELKVILAIKLNDKDLEELYNEYLKKELLPENENFVKLYYVQNALSKNFTKGEMTLRINGVEEVVEVRNIGLTRKLIKGKDQIEVVKMTDNLKFMIEQYKPVDFKDVPRNNYIISKTYSKKNPNLGDLVEVTITLDNVKLYNDGKYSMKLEDAIPNNMTFVEYLYGTGTNGYLSRQDGQKLTINTWNPYNPKWNPSATKSYIKYQVRVTNDGEQYEPGTILEKYDNKILDGIR